MKKNFKKQIQKVFSSRENKIVILGIVCCLLLVGLSPTIYNATVGNPTDDPEQSDDESNNNNPEYKQTNYNTYISFYWDPRYPDPGESVTFYANNYDFNGHLSSLRWNFGDGGTGYGFITSHTYEKEGRYRVTLSYTTWDTDYGYDWDSSTNYVSVGEDPFPKITFTPEDPSPGEKVTLDASASNDPDGEITSYTWTYYNFEDPANVTTIGSAKRIEYTWEKQGIYIVSLFIQDNKGNNNTIEETIRVSILKLGGFPKRARGLSFEISNHGTYQANNIEWGVEINKYSLLGVRSRDIYKKNGTAPDVGSGSSEKIEIKNIKRSFCKVKLVVTAKADNAIEVSKSLYGLTFGKFIWLSEDNFINPYNFVKITGIIALIIFILSRSENDL